MSRTLRNLVWMVSFAFVYPVLAVDAPASAPAGAAADAGGLTAEVAGLVEKLDAEKFAERQQAAEKLVDMGGAIRGVLEKMLADDGELTDTQKARIRDVLVDDGAIIRIEKTAGLDEDQILSLQEVRAQLVKSHESHRMGDELRKTVEEEEMSDDALALLVYSLLRQVKKQDGDSNGFEPVEDFHMKWRHKVAAIGGVDVDLLARGTQAEVKNRALQILNTCAPDGAYAAGSGNSITNYIPVDNYLAMVEALHEYNGRM